MVVGRPLNLLLDIYKTNVVHPPINYICVADGIWVSQITNLSLEEYCLACGQYSLLNHKRNCGPCKGLVKAGEIILANGISELPLVFRTAFPGITYSSQHAKQRLLRMPLVAIRVGLPSSGRSEIKLMEYLPGIEDT
jgi:hypothetical protein